MSVQTSQREERAVATGVAGVGLLAGKTALILGVADKHSIAWGIAKAMHDQGASLAFTYQEEPKGPERDNRRALQERYVTCHDPLYP